MPKRIFVIDDDPNMIQVATAFLKPEGFVVTSQTDPVKAWHQVEELQPDLVLLDIRMPEMDGYAVCRELKSNPKTKSIPIIMLSLKSDQSDVATGLELGAEDYIRKPYQEIEFLARVRTALRRNTQEPEKAERLTCGDLTLDYGSYEARLNDEPLALTPKEFELLGFFIRNEGRVLTRAIISEKLWGVDYSSTSRAIDYHVDQLRKKLGKKSDWIKNLRGVGYRFDS